MKRVIMFSLLTVLAIFGFGGCKSKGGDSSSVPTPSDPESSVVESSNVEEDLSNDIRDKAAAFVEAIKTNNVVMMETLGNAAVDTYGEWSKPVISSAVLNEVLVTNVNGIFNVSVNVSDVNGSSAVTEGENLFSLEITWNSDEAEYEFKFEKAEEI